MDTYNYKNLSHVIILRMLYKVFMMMLRILVLGHYYCIACKLHDVSRIINYTLGCLFEHILYD